MQSDKPLPTHPRVNTVAQQRRDANRAAMIAKYQAVAAPLFAEQGYHGTSIEHIAHAAGTAVGSLYIYFESKEDLFLSLLPAHLHALAETIKSSTGGSARDKLSAWRCRYVDEAFMVLARVDPNLLSPATAAAVREGVDSVTRAAGGRLNWYDFLGAIVNDRIRATIAGTSAPVP